MSHFVQGSSEPVLKPRDMGQILDHSFKVFGRNWKPLVTAGLIAAIPSMLWGLLAFSALPMDPTNATNHWMFPLIMELERGEFGGLWALMSVVAVALVAFTLLVPLYYGTLVDVATRAVLGMETVPLSESLRVGASRYWPMLGTYLLRGLIYLVAVPVLVIGGLVIFFFITVPFGLMALAVFMAFANHAIVIEGRGGGLDALRRAYELGKSRFWPLLGLGIVFNLMVYVVSSIISTPLSMSSSLMTVMGDGPPTWLFSAIAVISGLIQAVTVPFLIVGLTVVYFDTRVRREGYDLEVAAQHQAQADTAHPTPNER